MAYAQYPQGSVTVEEFEATEPITQGADFVVEGILIGVAQNDAEAGEPVRVRIERL